MEYILFGTNVGALAGETTLEKAERVITVTGNTGIPYRWIPN